MTAAEPRAQIDTELARLELVSPNLVVAHLKPDVKITESRVLEVRQARRSLVSGLPMAMFVIAPGERNWQASALGTDFFGPEKDRIKALAVMVDASLFFSAVNLYFGLHRGKCPVKLVSTVEDGYAWLAKRGFAPDKAGA